MYDNYFESEEFQDNLGRYEEFCQQGTPVYLDSEALTDIAEYYHSQGRSRQALDVVDYALSMFQGATAPLVFKARMALLNGEDAMEAERIADQITDKSDLDYYYIKGEIMVADGRPAAAHHYLEECATSVDDEDYPDYVLDVATIFADYEQMEYAQEWLAKSEEKNLPDYRELLGRIYLGTGRYEESEKIFNGLIDENPFSPQYWNELASAQFMQNHYNECITSSEYAIAINPRDEDALLNKANGLLNLENYEDAWHYYQLYTQVSANKDVGELYQGVSLLNMNRVQEAVIHMKKAENHLTPHSTCAVELYQELAFGLSRLGHTEEALRYVDKTDPLLCDHQEMLVLRGHIVLECHRVEEANHYFLEALSQSKYAPNIILRVAISLYDNNYVEEAYDMFSALANIVDGNWTSGFSYLAACARELGKFDEYLEALREAVRRNPQEARVVLSDQFPEGMAPDDYYQYAKNNPSST